jgi:hypothetical protein
VLELALLRTSAGSTIYQGNVSLIAAHSSANNDAIVADLITAPTVIKRFRELLTDAGQTALSGDALAKASIYDFNANSVPIPGSNGGKVGAALVDTMPYLLDSGLNTNLGYVGPCGVLVPHVHPRASEFFTVVAGELLVGTIPERGLLNDGYVHFLLLASAAAALEFSPEDNCLRSWAIQGSVYQS